MRAAVLCAIALAVAPAATASPTLGIVGSGSATRLVQLDPRTLRPLDQGVRIGLDVVDTARSPDGSQVAVATVNGPLIVDPRRHRVQTPGGADTSQGIVWPGTTASGEPLLVAVGSSGYGFEYTVIGPAPASMAMDTAAPPVALLRAGLVISDYDPRSLLVLGQGDARRIHLPRMPDAWFTVVADVRGDRLFVVSAGGVIGEVDHVAGKPQVTYHTVDLNGKPFTSAWAGNGRIALWGTDGLGEIDTRDWSAHAIAPAITDTTSTAYGIIAWNKSGAGLALYRASGKLRFRALAARHVTDVEAGDRYAYATTTSGRFAIDLRTGQVTGPLASTARLVPPSFGGPLPGCSWACRSHR